MNKTIFEKMQENRKKNKLQILQKVKQIISNKQIPKIAQPTSITPAATPAIKPCGSCRRKKM